MRMLQLMQAMERQAQGLSTVTETCNVLQSIGFELCELHLARAVLCDETGEFGQLEMVGGDHFFTVSWEPGKTLLTVSAGR